MAEEPNCIFSSILKTCSEGNKQISKSILTEQRLKSILNSSKERNNGFESILSNQSINETEKLYYHQSCYINYNSKSKIEKYLTDKRKVLEKQSSSTLTSPPSKKLRSRYCEARIHIFVCRNLKN